MKTFEKVVSYQQGGGNKMMYSKTANETNWTKKYLEDNLHQLRRQLLTIQESILLGLEECAGRIGNPQQNDLF